MQVPSLLSKREIIPRVYRDYFLCRTRSTEQNSFSQPHLCSLCQVSSIVGKLHFAYPAEKAPLHISYGNGELKLWHFQGQSVSLLLSK